MKQNQNEAILHENEKNFKKFMEYSCSEHPQLLSPQYLAN